MSCLSNNLLRRNIYKLLFSNIKSSQIRVPSAFSSTGYDGDGKTTVTILNKEADLGLMVNSYSQVGFRLNNGITVIGPMAIFPKSVLSWNIDNRDDISEDSLALFTVLEPKIDILVLGIGSEKVTPDFSKKIRSFMINKKINVEVLNTEQACATFNFLNGEGRCVGAALIPPNHININEDDVMKSKMRYNNLYGPED